MPDRSTGTWHPISTSSLSGSGQTSGKLASAYRELNLYFRATSAGSTLDFTVETSPDNSNWFTLATVVQITGTGNTHKAISANLGEYVRLSYTAQGTWGVDVQGIFKT